MFEIVKAGGIVMVPIILCSIIAVAITLERLWVLQQRRVLPKELTEKVWRLVKAKEFQDRHIEALEQNSPLGQVLAAGLANRHRGREFIKEALEDTGRHVVHELERFLNTLGTIAAMSPLLGLLGTVFGIIHTFSDISAQGVGNPQVLSSGISQALITTAAGLTIAIPSLVAYRYLRGRVESLVVQMEKEAMKLVRALDERNRSVE